MFTDTSQRIVPENIYLLAAAGKIERAFTVHNSGFNPSVGTTPQTIWDDGGLYPWIGSASHLTINSTDINDKAGGTGAQTLYLQGIDANYNLIDEVVKLKGTQPILSSLSYKTIHRMSVPSLFNKNGIPVQNEAQGTITAKVNNIIRAKIIKGNNNALMSIFTVPANYKAFMISMCCGVGKGKEATIQIFTRVYGGVFRMTQPSYLYQTESRRPFTVPMPINEKTDVDIRAFVDSTPTIGVGVSFDLLVARN